MAMETANLRGELVVNIPHLAAQNNAQEVAGNRAPGTLLREGNLTRVFVEPGKLSQVALGDHLSKSSPQHRPGSSGAFAVT